jgi:hypothetical protein
MVTRTTIQCFYTVFSSLLTLARKKQGNKCDVSLASRDYEPEKRIEWRKINHFLVSHLPVITKYKAAIAIRAKEKSKSRKKKKRVRCA